MKRLFRRRLSKMTLLAFATSLFIVPAASAMPMSIDPAANSRTPVVAFHAQPAVDGWYSAAVRTTLLDRAVGDGWYTAQVDSFPRPAATPIGSDGFPYRDAGIALALALILTAVLAAGVVRARRERQIPVLQ